MGWDGMTSNSWNINGNGMEHKKGMIVTAKGFTSKRAKEVTSFSSQSTRKLNIYGLTTSATMATRGTQ
jgi:hypothetical protein